MFIRQCVYTITCPEHNLFNSCISSCTITKSTGIDFPKQLTVMRNSFFHFENNNSLIWTTLLDSSGSRLMTFQTNEKRWVHKGKKITCHHIQLQNLMLHYILFTAFLLCIVRRILFIMFLSFHNGDCLPNPHSLMLVLLLNNPFFVYILT